MCREKLVELVETLKSNGFNPHVKEVNNIINSTDMAGGYTFLIYFAKRINPSFVKGHKLPEVIKSLVPCTRCSGQGSSSKWQFTGHTCYECHGNGSVLKGQQTFREYMKGLAESTAIEKLENGKAERTFTVEYFKPNTKEVTDTFKFKVSELTDTSWTGIEQFVNKKLNLVLQVRTKGKTVREYHNYGGGGVRIKF